MITHALALIALSLAAPARADVSDSGNLTIAGQGVIQGTMTVQGSSFSVGGTTFSVAGGSVTLGGRLNAAPAGIKWADGSVSTTAATSSSGVGLPTISTFTYLTGMTYTTPNAVFGSTCVPGTSIEWVADGSPYIVELQSTIWHNAGPIAIVAGYLLDGSFPNSKQTSSKGLKVTESSQNISRPLDFIDVITPAAGTRTVCLALLTATSHGYVVTFGSFSGVTATSVFQVRR